MRSRALFRTLDRTDPGQTQELSIVLNGKPQNVPAGVSVAAALLTVGPAAIRRNLADDSLRGPYCMMGACFECLVEIDGVPGVQSCMVNVAEGMHIRTLELSEEGND